MVELRILGPLQVSALDGRDVDPLVRRSKRAALLAYLAAALPQGLHRRDKLLALFWAESDERHARGALSQALYVLRRTLGETAVLTRGDDEVGLDGDLVWCDASAFEAALDAGRPAEGLALYRGDLLDGFFITGAPEFEHWLERERARLRQRASEGAWALAEAKVAQGDVVEAERWARWAADLLPADEAVVRRLMAFLDHLGDRAAAISAYAAFASRLAREYELEPSAETNALALTIRQEAAHPASALTPMQVPLRTGHGRQRPARRRAWFPAAAVAVILLIGYGLASLVGTEADPGQQGPRIAVLPFQNLGAPEDAYFADGITDEITARLAMVGGLTILGREVALEYAASRKSARQIVTATGVDYVLEGTVTWQRSPSGHGRVRVRPQLINTRDGTHVWATVLDEDMADAAGLFAILSRIANTVAEELHVALKAPERRSLARIPTTNLEAYDLYLRGRDFRLRTWSEANTRASIEMLERAVQKDPEFALAHAWLSFAYTRAYWANALGADYLARAKGAGETAARLDPDLPDAHVALGHYYYACCDDYERALQHFTASLAGRPGDAQVVMMIGNVYKRRGQWDDARRYLQRAARLDARWRAPLLNLAQVDLWVRRYDDAQRTIDRALAIEPQEAFAHSIRAWIPLLREGDVEEARRLLRNAAAESDGFAGMRLPFYLELVKGDYRAAFSLAGGRRPPGGAWDEWLSNDHLRQALTLRLLGDSGAARALFESAVAELDEEARLASRRSRRAHNLLASALAISYAGLGRRSEAAVQAERVLATDPPGIDAISGPVALQNVALAYTLMGEKTAALEVLGRLLSIPACFSAELLRLDPLWDPLRRDPRFQQLMSRG